MEYRTKKWHLWKRKLDIPNDLQEKIYKSKVSIAEYLENDLMGKIPLELCLDSKYRPLAKLIDADTFLKLDWELITDENLPIVQDIVRYHGKARIGTPILDFIYESLYKKIINPDAFYLGNKKCESEFFYTEDTSDAFRRRYPELYLDDVELPSQIIDAFYSGELKFDDYINHFDVLKNKNIGRTLKYDFETNASYHRFINEHEDLAILLFKYHKNFSVPTIEKYYQLSNESERKIIITKDLMHSYRKAMGDIPNEELRIYLNYLSLEDIYTKGSIIDHIRNIGVDKILASSLSLDYLAKNENDSVLHFISEFGIENVDEFNRSSDGFLTKGNYRVMREIYSSYFEFGHLKDQNVSFSGEYSFKQFNEIMRRMIINVPRNYKVIDNRGYQSAAPFNGEPFEYSFITGPFREQNPDLFLDENAPEELKVAFYTKKLSPDIIRNHQVGSLEGKQLDNRFVNLDVELSAGYNNTQRRSWIPFLLEEFGFDGAMEMIRNHTLDRQILPREISVREEDFNKPINDVIYQMIYEAILKQNQYNGWFSNNFSYPEGMSESFKKRYPGLFLDGIELPTEIVTDFYKGSLRYEDFIAHWNIFKNRDIGRTLGASGTIEFIQKAQANLNRFVSEHAGLAKLIYGNYLLGNRFYSADSDEKRREIINKAIRENACDGQRNYNKSFVSNEDLKIYMSYQTAGQWIFDAKHRRVNNEYYNEEEQINNAAQYVQAYSRDLMDLTIPLDLLFVDSNVMKFVKEFGIINVENFNRLSGGFFTNDDCNRLQEFARFFVHAQNEKKGIPQRPHYSREDFYSVLRDMIIYGNMNYREIQGEFRALNQDFFIDENAPEELKESFYNRRVYLGSIEENPEYKQLLRGKNLRFIYSYNQSYVDKLNRELGNEAAFDVYLEQNGDDDKIRIITKILSKKTRPNMSVKEKLSYITPEAVERASDRDALLRSTWSYRSARTPQLEEAYPDLFLTVDIPKEKLDAIEERIARGEITTDFFEEYKEYAEEIKALDAELLFRGLYTQAKSPNPYSRNIEDINIIEIIKGKIGNEATVDLMLSYHTYLQNSPYRYSTTLYDDLLACRNKSDIISALNDLIYLGIKQNRQEYDANMPASFKDAHPDLFLPDMPEEMKTILGKKLYGRSLTSAFVSENPEYVQYLKNIDIEVAFAALNVSATDQYDNKRKDVNLVAQIKHIFGNEEGLDVMAAYGKYLSQIHYDYRNHPAAIQFMEIMTTYSGSIDRGPHTIIGSKNDIPDEIMRDFMRHAIKSGNQELLRHLKNLVYVGIKDMRIPFDERLPDEFKNEHPDLFLPHIPNGEKLKELFYKRELTAEELANYPESLEYLRGIDINLLLKPMKVYVSTDPENPHRTESINFAEYLRNSMGNELGLNLLFSYGKYLERTYDHDYGRLVNGEFNTMMNEDAFIIHLKKVIYLGIKQGRIIYDEKLPEDFREEYQDVFLPVDIPDDIKSEIEDKFYRRKLTLDDFSEPSRLLSYLDNVDIVDYLEPNFSWMRGLFSDTPKPNSLRIKAANEYEKIQVDSLKRRFSDYVINNKESLTIENISQLSELLFRLSYSNSSEIHQFGNQLAGQLMLEKEPLEILNEIEGVFLRNNLPTIGKVYSVFQLIYPEYRNIHLESNIMSPVIQKNAHRKVAGIRVLDIIIFTDLLKASLGSNNRSLKKYLENIEVGSSLVSGIISGELDEASIGIEQQKILKTFVNHLRTLYNNTQVGRKNQRIGSKEIREDIEELLVFFETEGIDREELPNRLIRMFAGPAGFRTMDEVTQYIRKRAVAADLRNREREKIGASLELGDFIKGIGDLKYITHTLQNGAVAREFLGAGCGSDMTPLDTDIWRVLDVRENIEATFDRNVSDKGYGPIWLVLKNDERFTITRQNPIWQDKPVDEQELDSLEAFYTGARGEHHYGVRTGFSSSNVDFIMTDKEYPELGFEIVRNGFYIPVYDRRGNLIFSSVEYDKLKEKMRGLSHYGTGEYVFAGNLSTTEIEIIASQIDETKRNVSAKRDAIMLALNDAIIENGLILKTYMDGDLTENFIEIIDTGSSGRATCVPNVVDFDFALRIDRKIRFNPKKLDKLVRDLLKVLGKEKLGPKDIRTGDGNYQLKGVKIPGVEEELEIDLTFIERTDKVSYSTDMSIKDRLNTIMKQSPERYPLVLANIILGKRILQNAKAYKPSRSDSSQGGLGGVGIENWILQHGGSLEAAARSFLEASEGKTFDEFRREYAVWDAGENLKMNDYLHDNFVSRNMNEIGYEGMKKALSRYLHELYPEEIIVYEEESFEFDSISKVNFGSGEMYECIDSEGKSYLFKPAYKKGTTDVQTYRAYIQEAAYEVQKLIDPGSAIYCKTAIVNGMFGAIQEKIDVIDSPYLIEKDPVISSQLLREFVTDYLLSNHDGYRRNFILGKDGILRGIDKEQSLRFIKNEPKEISIDYNPNGEDTAYNEVFRRYTLDRKIDLDFKVIYDTLDRVDTISDEEFCGIFRKYINAACKNTIEREELIKLILERKRTIRERMENFVNGLIKAREELSITKENEKTK